MPAHIIDLCSKRISPQRQEVRSQAADGRRVARLVIGFHPLVARGLQSRVCQLAEEWKGVLRHAWHPLSPPDIKIVYRGAGKVMSNIARRLRC